VRRQTNFLTLLLLAGLTLPAPVRAQPQPMLIAVIDLDVIDVGEGEARAITERLRVKLSEQAIFDVVERNRMQSILTEQGFQFSGACDTDECVVQVGRILGVRKMVAGSVSKVGTLYSLQVRIVDVESARIEHVAYTDVNGIEQVMTEATAQVADELARKVAGEAVPEPEPAPVRDPGRETAAQPGGAGPVATDWRSEARHTGWLMRLSPGPASLTGTADSRLEPATFTGAGFGWDILFGKIVVGDLMLFFNIGNDRAADPDAEVNSVSQQTTEDDELKTSYVGTGLGFYFPPRQWWVATALVFSSFTFAGSDPLNPLNNKDTEGEPAVGYYLAVGKDWWLARGLSLGVMMRIVNAEHVIVSGLNLGLTIDLTRNR